MGLNEKLLLPLWLSWQGSIEEEKRQEKCVFFFTFYEILMKLTWVDSTRGSMVDIAINLQGYLLLLWHTTATTSPLQLLLAHTLLGHKQGKQNMSECTDVSRRANAN